MDKNLIYLKILSKNIIYEKYHENFFKKLNGNKL